jgi:hypothetical protein
LHLSDILRQLFAASEAGEATTKAGGA